MKAKIITNEILNKEVTNKPARFDMAINFYCCIKKAGEYFLVGYYYNSVWDKYYPFYDDQNKTPILKKSNSKTYKELIDETDKELLINLDEKLTLAHQRFEEMIDCHCKTIPSKHSPLYELKYSKTANIHTVYKLYNFIITQADDAKLMLNPSKFNCKLFNLNSLESTSLIDNAVYFAKQAKEELKQYAIEID